MHTGNTELPSQRLSPQLLRLRPEGSYVAPARPVLVAPRTCAHPSKEPHRAQFEEPAMSWKHNHVKQLFGTLWKGQLWQWGLLFSAFGFALRGHISLLLSPGPSSDPWHRCPPWSPATAPQLPLLLAPGVQSRQVL